MATPDNNMVMPSSRVAINDFMTHNHRARRLNRQHRAHHSARLCLHDRLRGVTIRSNNYRLAGSTSSRQAPLTAYRVMIKHDIPNATNQSQQTTFMARISMITTMVAQYHDRFVVLLMTTTVTYAVQTMTI